MNIPSVTFFALSDLGSNDRSILSDQVVNLPSTADFAVHLGDINDASIDDCNPDVYTEAESILSKSPIPLLVLPGNEDYAACPAPFESLDDWRETFVEFESTWLKKSSDNWVDRQSSRKENFAFFKNEVLFLGVNIAGKFARDDEQEWQDLDLDNINWTRERLNKFENEMKALVIFGHARPGPRQYEYYFQYIEQFLEGYDVPVLYLHGDALEDEPLLKVYEPYTDEGFKMKALEVQPGAVAKPVQVIASSSHGFVIDRRESN